MSPRVFASYFTRSPADLLLGPVPYLRVPRTSCSGATALRVSALGACSDLPRMGDRMSGLTGVYPAKFWIRVARYAGWMLAKRRANDYAYYHALAVEYWELRLNVEDV